MNVHILSDSPGGVSSYANMARNLALGLIKYGHNVSITGFQTFFKPENYLGIKVYPLYNPAEPDNPQTRQFKSNLEKSRADVLIGILEGYSQWSIYLKLFHNSYLWVPVEGTGIPVLMYENLKNTKPVAQSNFGKLEIASVGFDSDVIYPGWDPDVFTLKNIPYCKYSTEIHKQTEHPMNLFNRGCYECDGLHSDCKWYEEEEIIIRHSGKEYTRRISSLKDIRKEIGARYVIGCVANNMGGRKRLDMLIEAFSKMEYKKDSLLHIHAAITSQGKPLENLAKKFGIDGRVVITSGEYIFGLSQKALSVVYGNFDINASASGAEGFGIVQLETMGMGIPQAAPNFGTFPELFGFHERGLLAGIDRMERANNDTLWCRVNTNSLASAMDTLYINPILKKKMAGNATEWAKNYTWDKVADRWNDLLIQDNKIKLKEAC